MSLRVAVDATAIPGRRVGAGVYITELLAAMAHLAIDLDIFVNARDADELSSLVPRAALHPVRLPNRPARIMWAHSVLPLRIRRLGPEVFHGPHYTLPAGLRCPGVVTFHDPTFFTLPRVHERSKVAYFSRAARTGIARATRVIAVSEYARRGAIEHAGADDAAIDVVLNGVDHARYRPNSDGPAFPFEPYVLFVGALEPRKNVPALIEAYGEIASAGLPHHLVLAGPPAWGAAAVDAAVESLEFGKVHRLSYVPEEDKIRLLRRASAFVYPSLAEGFGLPVLEAMACGAPVLTTTGSAPQEIAADAALLVAPGDKEALRKALEQLLTDDGLVEDLRKRGLERARVFSWERCAEETIAVFRKAASS